MAKKPNYPHYDIDYVRRLANGRWTTILSALGGADVESLDGQHHPCPKCGGKDRFRFTDVDGDGSCICNQCGKFGNGFDALCFLTGEKFAVVLAKVAEYLGVAPSLNGQAKSPSTKQREKADPAEHLKWLDWREGLVALWALHKPPVTPAAALAVGGRLARYRDRYTVLALPVWGEQLDAAEPVGWSLYNITGGMLPRYRKNQETNTWEIDEWLKVKLTAGSQPGVIADLSRLRACDTLWKMEGPSDLLAFLSLADLPANVAGITNANGAGEQPAEWMLQLFADKPARVLHDADLPGQRGALTYTDERGRERPGWANRIATQASECRNVVLPYPIADTHGKDLRDFAQEGNDYLVLQRLAEESTPIGQSEVAQTKPIEGPDNFHRLARLNLERYAKHTPGGTLRYWRNEWYKYDGFCYRQIDDSELKSKVGQAVKEEFDRINLEDVAKWSGEGNPPNVRNVTQALISNVLFATSQLPDCLLSGTVELNTWIDSEENTRERRRYVTLRNGILDIDGFLKGEDGCLRLHSPNWFSLVCLPYDFNPDAKCPRWLEFMNKNQEGDQERIKLLQEWAGYMLLPTTDFQKFLFFEGEGSNGKSVFLAAVEAMLGVDNCTHVSLEVFAQPFMLTQTLGKLANITAECSEMDSVAEGYLKSFASGDRMTFNRKGIPPIDAAPTARLMISANVRPRFADKSSGLWRRMILVPWRVTIQDHEKVFGMDKVGWWQQSGELPGIFNWALAGLHRLTQNQRFTKSAVCEAALASYRNEMNPAKVFIAENYIAGNEFDMILCEDIYDQYKEWALENGHRYLNDGHFGAEVKRHFPESTRRRIRLKDGTGKRPYAYFGIQPRNDEEEVEVQSSGTLNFSH